MSTHLIFVVDVDTEPKWSGAESLIGNETILKGCLVFGLNHTVQCHRSELQQHKKGNVNNALIQDAIRIQNKHKKENVMH